MEEHRMGERRKLVDKWLSTHRYLSKGNISIESDHTYNVTQLERVIFHQHCLSPKRIIYRNSSGCCLYKPQTGVLVLYSSPFDVIIKHGYEMVWCKSALWMRDIIDDLFKNIKRNNPSADIKQR